MTTFWSVDNLFWQGLTTDGYKEETDVKNAESTDPKETLSGSKVIKYYFFAYLWVREELKW